MGLGKKKHIDILDLKTVLILDKDIGSLKLLQIYVENLGAHHVLAVQDLAEAWLYVNTKKIDLVVTDWKFIDSNGLTFYERIRSSPKMQKMPIILVSGFVTKNEIETTKKDSKMRFLVKPFPQDLFFGCVHQLFKFNPPDKGTKDLARNKSHQNKLDVTPHGMEKPTRQSNVIVLKGDGRFADRGIEIHKGHGVDRGLGIEVHEGPGSISGRGTIVEPGEQVDRSLGIDVQKYNQSGGGQNVIVDGNDESKPGFDIKVQDSQYRGWGLDVNQERLSPKANDLIQSELGADGGTATATSPFKAISADGNLAWRQSDHQTGKGFTIAEPRKTSSGWAVRVNVEKKPAQTQSGQGKKIIYTDLKASKQQEDAAGHDLQVNSDPSRTTSSQSPLDQESGQNSGDWSMVLEQKERATAQINGRSNPSGGSDIGASMTSVQRAAAVTPRIEYAKTKCTGSEKMQDAVRKSGDGSDVAPQDLPPLETRKRNEDFRSVLEVNGYFDNPPGILELFPPMPRRVMIIDDDPAQLNLIESYLRKLSSIDIEKYTDAYDAWQALSLGTYDLVITEWRLKAMSGLCLYNRIRNSRKMARLPVIVMSGFLHKEDIRLLDEDSYTNVLEKPLQLKPFLKILSSTIAEANAHTRSLNRVVELMSSFGSNPPDLSVIVEKMPIERTEAAQFVLSAAQYFFCEGKYAESEKMLKAALRLKPDSLEVKCELAKVYHRTNRPSDALVILKSAEKKAPGAIERLCLMGELGLKLNQIEDAQVCFKKVLQIDEENQFAKDGATIAGNMCNHIEGYGRKNLTEKFASSLNIIGITLVRNNKIQEGIEQYRAASSFVDDMLIRAKLNFNIGLAYLRSGRLEEAEDWLRKADSIANGELPKAAIYAEKVSALRRRGSKSSEDLSKDIENIFSLNEALEQK
jgi:two-component system chemotaxis response regulator CheY